MVGAAFGTDREQQAMNVKKLVGRRPEGGGE